MAKPSIHGPCSIAPVTGTANLNWAPRIYLLYTGQHYDPIVSGSSADVAVDQEQKRQKKGGEAAKGTEMLGDLKVCFLRSKLEMEISYEIIR